MSKFTLVLFPDGERASDGFRALEWLDRNGSISLRGAALVERDEHGLLSLRSETRGDLLGAGLNAVVARAPRDLLEFLTRDLAPGSPALIAEVSDEEIPRVYARMVAVGGTLVCQWRTRSGDEALAQPAYRDAELELDARSAAG
jgi:hypothetical protein